MAGYDVVVLTEASTADAVALDAATVAGGGRFIRADARGVFGSVFCDFGPAFLVADTDGEQPATGIVAGVTPIPERGATLVTQDLANQRAEHVDVVPQGRVLGGKVDVLSLAHGCIRDATASTQREPAS
jgi:ubiquitin-activating enzyme E1